MSDRPRSFSEGERKRFANLLKLASESPFEGERDAALAAAERMAHARGMSLHDAASMGAPPPRRGPDRPSSAQPDSEAAAREKARRDFARFVHASDAWIQADKARRETAMREARERGLDAEERRNQRNRQPPRSNGARRDPKVHAEVLLTETRLPLREVASITGLDIYKVVEIKLKMRKAA